jgi:hypothetical protein
VIGIAVVYPKGGQGGSLEPGWRIAAIPSPSIALTRTKCHVDARRVRPLTPTTNEKVSLFT